MAASFRVLTAPVQPSGGARGEELAALVAADVLCRRARARGLEVHWVPAVLTGDLAGQHATERELARAGLDRASLGRAEFAERIREHEAADRARLGELLAALRVGVEVDEGATDRPAVEQAARTAFVRLYEEGRLVLDDRVVGTCPRCATVVDRADAEAGELDAEESVLDLVLDDGQALPVSVVALELLPGAVAVAVPDDHPAAGHTVVIPIADRSVPVLAAPVQAPCILVPAHDGTALETARKLGLAATTVLDRDGVVSAPGPLEGMTRFAAREAAVAHLEAEGLVSDRHAATERVGRCRRCGSVLVPRLGRHWFLAMSDLEVAAADAVRQGDVTVAPPAARDEFLASAGQSRDWCVSHQLWAGERVPMARCLDCGGLTVGVDIGGSCGTCMGTLEGSDDVLDARFVAAVAALADSGWPGAADGPAAASACTTFVTAAAGLCGWGLRIAALGLRLAGVIPFTVLAVQDAASAALDPDRVEALATEHGPAAGRLALLCGLADEAAAVELAGVLSAPAAGDGDIDRAIHETDAALDCGMVATAATVLGSVAREGVPEAFASAARWRDLAAPLLGD